MFVLLTNQATPARSSLLNARSFASVLNVDVSASPTSAKANPEFSANRAIKLLRVSPIASGEYPVIWHLRPNLVYQGEIPQ